MIKYLKEYLNELMVEFGFDNYYEFLMSTFGFSIKKPILFISVSLAFAGTAIQNVLGLDPVVYGAFIVLLVFEFFTGIRASRKEGKRIQSKRLGRVILKIMVYTLIIGIVNIFRTRLEIPSAFGMEINIYSLIYFASLNLIIFQLLLSVFENLSRLGYRESSIIFSYLARKAEKWFSLDDGSENKSEDYSENK